jgi:hypothetical protein
MDYKSIKEMFEDLGKRPRKTISILIVLLLIAIMASIFVGYFSEKGKQLAIPPNRKQVHPSPSSTTEIKKNKDIVRPAINQHTEGSQSPAVNVAPGGNANIEYNNSANKGE